MPHLLCGAGGRGDSRRLRRVFRGVFAAGLHAAGGPRDGSKERGGADAPNKFRQSSAQKVVHAQADADPDTSASLTSGRPGRRWLQASVPGQTVGGGLGGPVRAALPMRLLEQALPRQVLMPGDPQGVRQTPSDEAERFFIQFPNERCGRVNRLMQQLPRAYQREFRTRGSAGGGYSA